MTEQCFPIKLLNTDKDGNQELELCFCKSCCSMVAAYMRKGAERVLKSDIFKNVKDEE